MQTSSFKIPHTNPTNIIQTVAIRLNQQGRELYLFTMNAEQIQAGIAVTRGENSYTRRSETESGAARGRSTFSGSGSAPW